MRAFLPVSDDNERSRLTEYRGYATVVDTRVVCMRPKLKDVIFSADSGFTLTGLADIEEKPAGMASGSLPDDLSDDLSDSLTSTNNFSLTFNCAFAAAAPKKESSAFADQWPIALCQGTYLEGVQGT